jgi:hypothetical protein
VNHDPIITLSADYRIRPLDHLQWILERRSVTGGGRWKAHTSQLEHAGESAGRWLPYAYCRTRIGLTTALSRLRCEGIHLDPMRIAHLPDYFPGPAALPP